MFSVFLKFENTKLFDVIANFLSITIGFTITALSIIATSPFSRRLYQIQSDTDNGQSLLHVLIKDFKHATLIFIVTIVLIVVLYYYPDDYKGNRYNWRFLVINDINTLKSIIVFLSVMSFYKFIYLFYTFSKFVIKSSTEN